MKITETLILAAVLAAGLSCGYSKKTTPPAPGTMPTITQLSPASATAGGAAFQLEVDGTNFATAAVVNFNGVAQTTTWVSAAKVEAMIPASAIMNSGIVPVTVTDPGTPGGTYGGGTLPETSAPMNFTIN
jgi:IPT/TIG domain-containing protein